MIHSDPAQFTEPRRTSRAWWLLVPVGLFGLVMLIGAMTSDPAKTRDRDVIAACWAQHDSKALPPSEKRTVAGICEGLEREFTAKHGSRP